MKASQEIIFTETLLIGSRPNGYWTACLMSDSEETERARKEAQGKAAAAIRGTSNVVGLFGSTLEWCGAEDDDD